MFSFWWRQTNVRGNQPITNSRLSRQRTRLQRKPYLESLEDRCLPALTMTAFDVPATPGYDFHAVFGSGVPDPGPGGVLTKAVLGADGNFWVASTTSVVRLSRVTTRGV